MEHCKQEKAITELMIAQAKHEERICDMEDYRTRQNGAVMRVEQKIDSVNGKLDDLKQWMLNKLVTVVVSFGIFVLGLVSWLVQRG